MIASDQIPVAMIMKAAERTAATYRCTRHQVANPNAAGWKIAHIAEIGLGRGHLEDMPLDALTRHFTAFLAPSNMFVVPLKWEGLAEVPEVIETFAAAVKIG